MTDDWSTIIQPPADAPDPVGNRVELKAEALAAIYRSQPTPPLPAPTGRMTVASPDLVDLGEPGSPHYKVVRPGDIVTGVEPDYQNEKDHMDAAQDELLAITKWIPGVTPTGVQCPHGQWITLGKYLEPDVPTGLHPDCFTAYVAEEEQTYHEMMAQQWADYYRECM
jgi:hypothetical protein